MRKFNLSVPDDLAEKIQARRDELGSLSAIFQMAVAEKIGKKEEFEKRLKGDQDMEAVVQRLKKEKIQAKNNYFEKGKEDGLQWAKAASFEDLQYARRFDPTDEEGVCDPTIPLHDDVLGHYFIDMLESDPLTNPEDDDEVLNDFATQWLMGWLEVVGHFCTEVVDPL